MGRKRIRNWKKLILNALGKGSFGCITKDYGGYLAEAASVCLENQKHRSGVNFSVDGEYNEQFVLIWQTITDQMRRCHNDLEVATEYGAYGIAVLLIHALTEFTVVERSRKGTGFDYWLGPKSNKGSLFQNKARLEVSGILKNNDYAFRARIVRKT